MTKPCSLLSWWTMDAATGLWPGFPFFPFWGDTEQLKINLAGIWELAGRNPTAFRPVALNHLSWPDPGSFSQLPPLLAFPAAILISDFPSTGREEGAPGPPAQTCGRCCSPPEVSAAVSFGSLSANLSSCSCLFWLLLTFPPWPQDCQQGWGGVRIGTQLSGVPNCGLPLTPQALLWRGTETRKVTVGIRTGRCAFKMFATLKGLAHKKISVFAFLAGSEFRWKVLICYTLQCPGFQGLALQSDRIPPFPVLWAAFHRRPKPITKRLPGISPTANWQEAAEKRPFAGIITR